MTKYKLYIIFNYIPLLLFLLDHHYVLETPREQNDNNLFPHIKNHLPLLLDLLEALEDHLILEIPIVH